VEWRRARNKINDILENDQWCEDKEVVKANVRDFFKAKFDGVSRPQVRLDNDCFNSISSDDNALLVGAFSEEEVKTTVWSCACLKSLGPDAFNFCCDCLKEDILSAMNDFVSDVNVLGGKTLHLYV